MPGKGAKPDMDWIELFFTTRGRVSRRTFWIIVGAWFLAGLLLRLGISLAARWSGNEYLVAVFFWTWVAYSCATYFPMLALSIKRLHDTGRSAMWIALPFFSVFSALLAGLGMLLQAYFLAVILIILTLLLLLSNLIVIVFYFLPSDFGSNAYGSSNV